MAMREILLDTNAYAAFKRGVPEVIETIRHAPFIGISSIVLGELLAGFAVGSREAANVEELRRFMDSPRVRLLPVDDVTASHYAGVYKDLRRLGQPIPTNDMWIAATALQHQLAVMSFDGHFKAVKGIVAGTCLTDFSS
jgi:predicted nucleic acid-binding protein